MKWPWQKSNEAWGNPAVSTAAPDTSRPAAGSLWTGPKTYTTDPIIGRPGFYALEDDGRAIIEPHILLTHIDDAPGNEEDGAGHWVVADPDLPYYSHQPPHLNPTPVTLEASVQGVGGVTVE